MEQSDCPTRQIFEDLHDSRTQAYVTGRVG